MRSISLLATVSLLAVSAAQNNEDQVASMLRRMETDVLAFRDEIERAYSERCTAQTLTECAGSSFNSCWSTFPNQECMEADELVIPECGGGDGNCNGQR